LPGGGLRGFLHDMWISLTTYTTLDRDARLAIMVQILVTIAIAMQEAIFSVYLSIAGYSEGDIGLVISVSMFLYSVLLIPGGIVADSLGRKRVSALGLILGAVSFIGYLNPMNLYYLILIASIGGVGSALFGGTISAILADVAPTPDRRNAVFSIAASLSSLAGVLGSLAGASPRLLQSLGYNAKDSYYPVLLVMAISLAVSSVLVIIIRSSEARRSGGSKLYLPRKSSDIIIRGIAYAIVISLGAGIITQQLFALWLFKKFSVGQDFIAYLFALSRGILMFAFLASPAIAKRLGSVNSIVLTQSIGTAILLAIAVASNSIVAGFLYSLRYVLMNMTTPILRSLILGLVDPAERATASSVMALALNLPGSFTPAVGGYLMSEVSLEIPFYVATPFYATAIAMFYVFFKGYEKK